MILRFVIEVKPIIEPSETSKEWAYTYYGSIVKNHLERHFQDLKVYGFEDGKRTTTKK